ncbi:MAG: S8 family serine peptidase [Nigerium sp.]|nr:S8 family serine peptidase [Nigerium sp.]
MTATPERPTPERPTPKRSAHAVRVAVALLVAGLILTAAGVAGAIRFADVLDGGTIRPDAGTLPTGEVVFNDRMSLYRPPADSFARDEASGAVFVADQLLVMFTDDATPEQAADAIKRWEGRPVGYLAAINRYEVLFDQRRSLAELAALAAEIEADPLVEIAYVNRVSALAPAFEPDDRGWQDQWNGRTAADGNWGMEAINAPVLWNHRDDIAANGVRIGVIDEGFNANEDLSIEVFPKSAKGQDHGTHVAGTIAARFGNDLGVAGVIPAVDSTPSLLGVPVEALASNAEIAKNETIRDLYMDGSTCLLSSSTDLALAYLVVERRTRIVNFSMGMTPTSVELYAASRGNTAAREGFSQETRAALHVLGRLLEQHDFLVVAAAGNEGKRRSFFDNPALGDADKTKPPLYVSDDKAEFGYRERRWNERGSAYNGELDVAVTSLFTFIGSSFDQRDSPEDAELAKRVRERVVVVGAAGLRDGRLYRGEFTNAGSGIDLFAPGVDIESTVGAQSENTRDCGGVTCGTMSGTSMAAPHVTGTLAALWMMNPGMSALEVKHVMLDNLQDGQDACSGNCMLDAGAAANALGEKNRAVTGGTGTSPRYPTADGSVTALVFDVSGSMRDPSGRTTTTDDGTGKTRTRPLSKLEAAKEAGKVLLSTVRSAAARYPGSARVGIAQFAGSGSEVVAPTSDYQVVQNAIDGLASAGGTNLLEALRVGGQQVSGYAGNRTAIILSDGRDESGKSDQEILQAAQKLASEGVKVCTIGFGEPGDLNEPLLRQVAAATGCSYSRAEASSAVALAGSFIAARMQSTSTLLAQQTGVVARGQSSLAMPMSVPDQTGDLTTVLYWPQAAAGPSRLDAVLIDPAGVRVDGSYPGVTVDDTQSPSQLVIADPLPGEWSLAVYGGESAPESESFFAAAAFEAMDREYPVNQVSRLVPEDDPRPLAPTYVMTATAIGLGAGPVLVFLGAAMLLVHLRHRP